MNKMWYIHIMEYYSAIRRNEILAHATTCMDLKDMLSEISQTQKCKYYCAVPFNSSTHNSQIHRDRKEKGGPQDRGRGPGG